MLILIFAIIIASTYYTYFFYVFLPCFLDGTFNLLAGKYFAFRKVNNKPLYINAKSNDPLTVIKELPKMINKRLSELSGNQEEFNKAKPLYEEALSESNYKASLKFEKSQYNTKRNRLRKVT